MWLYSPPYRSTVEQAAIERVFFNAYWRALRQAQMAVIRDLA